MATAAAATFALSGLAELAHHGRDGGSGNIPHDCKPRHSVVETSLSLFLCLGLVVSYLPQIVRIILKRSSVGFSPWFLFLGATSSASSFLNVVSLQWAVVSCCQWLTYGLCAESLLGIVQVGLQWLLFMSVFTLFLIYYPRELRFERAIALDGPEQGLLATYEDGQADEDGSSGDSGLDSIDSHIAENYTGAENGNTLGVDESGIAATSGLTAQTDDSAGESALASRLDANEDDERSSSAFSRLVPTFWPMWKAPPRSLPFGPMSKITATEPVPALKDLPSAPSPADTPSSSTPAPDLLSPSNAHTVEARRSSIVPRDDAAHVRIAAPPSLRKVRRRRIKTRTSEWSLALSLAWLVAFHFIFILLVTLLLVSSLPSTSFPPPPPSAPSFDGPIVIQGPSSRLLVDRWAAFLGWSAMLLAALQYLPQIVHTARIKLVGSLSIPMMCLQVPGSVIFVYSLALRPGVNMTSLAAYICTGVLQAVLLGLCIAWRIRQHRLRIDDFGRPLDPVEDDGASL